MNLRKSWFLHFALQKTWSFAQLEHFVVQNAPMALRAIAQKAHACNHFYAVKT